MEVENKFMEIKQVVYDYETVPTELRAMVDGIQSSRKHSKFDL